MVRITMTPRSIAFTSIGSRSMQLLTSVVALGALSASFPSSSAKGLSMRVGSHEANLLLLASFSSMMYAAWFLGCVELHKMTPRPRRIVCRTIDAALGLFLLVATIAFAASDYVHHCEEYTNNVRCTSVKASTAFAFLTLLPLGVSFALTFVTSTADNELECAPTGYVVETTPTSSFSPRPVANAPPTPSSKV